MDLHVAYIITRADAVGGATIHVRDLAREILARGGRATVLVGGTGEVTDELKLHGIPYVPIASLRKPIHPFWDSVAVCRLVSELRRLKPDLVSAHTAKAGLLGRVAAALCGIPAIYTPHGWAIGDRISKNGGRVFRVVERIAAPLSRRIVNVCEAERALAVRHAIAAPDRMAVVHNGVVDVDSALLADPEIDPPVITMVSRFEAPKDHSSLLKALGRLRELPWGLRLVGDGPLVESVSVQARALGILERIEFWGTSSDIAPILASSQIFVLSTRSEGFPRSVLEAMRAGLPVVASDVGGVSESVRNGHTGLTVPPGDPSALASALKTLIEQPRLRLRFGREGRRLFEDRYTFDKTFDQTIQIYSRVLSMHLIPRTTFPGEVR